MTRPAGLRTILLAACLGGSLLLSCGLLAEEAMAFRQAAFRVGEEGSGVRIEAILYEGRVDTGLEGPPYAVLLAEGFGGDQVGLRSAALAFARAGLAACTFDFPGQGRSGGTLGLDNAQTDRTARIIDLMARTLSDRTGIPPERIFLFGHSMGARSMLRSAVEAGPSVFAGLVLVGMPADMASHGTPTEAWFDRLSPALPAIPAAILAGSLDEILPAEAAREVFERLSGEDASLFPILSGAPFLQTETVRSADGRFLLRRYPLLAHNYEPLSPRVLDDAVDFVRDQAGPASTLAIGSTALRESLWRLSLLLLLAAALLAPRAFERKAAIVPAPVAPIPSAEVPAAPGGPAPSEPVAAAVAAPPDAAAHAAPPPGPAARRTLLLAWLPALVLVPLPVLAGWAATGGLPILNLVPAFAPGAHGIAEILLSRIRDLRTRFRSGVRRPSRRSWIRPQDSDLPSIGNRLLPVLAFIGAFLAWAQAGWYQVLPVGPRLLWTLLASLWSVPCFAGLLRDLDSPRRRDRAGSLLVRFLPIVLLLLPMVLSGSVTGVLAAAGLLLALVPAVGFGRAIRQNSRLPLAGAIAASFLFQVAVMAQGPLLLVG